MEPTLSTSSDFSVSAKLRLIISREMGTWRLHDRSSHCGGRERGMGGMIIMVVVVVVVVAEIMIVTTTTATTKATIIMNMSLNQTDRMIWLVD